MPLRLIASWIGYSRNGNRKNCVIKLSAMLQVHLKNIGNQMNKIIHIN